MQEGKWSVRTTDTFYLGNSGPIQPIGCAAARHTVVLPVNGCCKDVRYIVALHDSRWMSVI